MAGKEKEVEKVEEKKVNLKELTFQFSNQVLSQGYTATGDARVIKVVSNRLDEGQLKAGQLYIGTLDQRSRAYKYEHVGDASKGITGLTDFEVKVFGIAGAIVIPKKLEWMLRKNFND